MTYPPHSGGDFLARPALPGSFLTPEELPADTLFMAREVEKFVRGEVLPARESLENHDTEALRQVLQAAGDMGVAGLTIPEEYGGLGLPRAASARIAEATGLDLSFGISLGVHSGVATLPLSCFGTQAQKSASLPDLASARTIGAFALSEAGSGSDALSARALAVRLPGGGFELTGEKMWITNACVAGLFTVFARLEDAGFSAFLVPGDAEGLSLGPEEHKMGLRGSSTRRVLLDRVRLKEDALLGEPGEGHRPAFAALNLGRFQIGALCVGACKENLRLAAEYAGQRRQFGRPIAEFPLVSEKLASMASRTFLMESMLYRIAGSLDSHPGLPAQTAEEFALECALLKFTSTEALGLVTDESLQIHGGYGYSEEYPAARACRDARVFRIFEGTSEINRIAAAETAARRFGRGGLNLVSGGPTHYQGHAAPAINLLRDLACALMATYVALSPDVRRAGQQLAAAASCVAAELYALESAALRSASHPLKGMDALITFASWDCLQRILLPSLAAAPLDSLTRLHATPGEMAASLRPAEAAWEIGRLVSEAGGYPWL